jgi:hypothetical protein
VKVIATKFAAASDKNKALPEGQNLKTRLADTTVLLLSVHDAYLKAIEPLKEPEYSADEVKEFKDDLKTIKLITDELRAIQAKLGGAP